jgi:hypothetical protein
MTRRGRRILTDPVARRGRASRTKGHGFERALVHRFREIFPDVDGNPVVKRGIGQARSNCEVADVEMPHFWVEAKRRKRVNIREALEQAAEAAFKSSGPHRVPIVVSKEDTTGLPGQVDTRPAIVSLYLEDFLWLVGEWSRFGGGR